ncbi:MAG: hypothetical protein NZ958_02455 [Bacteroidia bacterium]|nr:hypothetical protein [Bacteroidia bacterium]MDW8089205.1 hypothetical protein [Bacteroidia bacterium]
MWAGLDLAASPRRPSGVVIGESWENLYATTAHSDEEILVLLRGVVQRVWVDAPLTCGEGPFRACDKLLHREGLTPLPLSWKSMQQLHKRAFSLQKLLTIPWHETFPWALYRHIFRLQNLKGRPHKDPLLLAHWGAKKGLRLQPTSIHEWDALACWAIGWLFQKGELRAIQAPDGTVWIP